jgi:hypothetical protein
MAYVSLDGSKSLQSSGTWCVVERDICQCLDTIKASIRKVGKQYPGLRGDVSLDWEKNPRMLWYNPIVFLSKNRIAISRSTKDEAPILKNEALVPDNDLQIFDDDFPYSCQKTLLLTGERVS